MKYRHKEYGLKWMILIFLFCIFGSVACDNKNQIAEANSKEASQLEQDNQVSKAPQPDDSKIEYNPALCKTDAKDKVYFALGRTVFSAHYQEPIFIRGMPPERKAALPKRPDPSEPEGCPDNPMWGGGFTFAYRYQALKENAKKPGRYMMAEQLSIIENSPSYWLPQDSLERVYEKRSEGMCAEIYDSFVACRIHGEEENPEDWAASYKANKDIYNSPFNRPFIVECNYSVVGRICRVVYKLHETILVSYKFKPEKIPINQVISFDKVLRSKLESMRVVNYKWLK